jgi:hypothetical protein
MFRVSRSRRGPDPTLGYRMLLLALGAATGLFGMATERNWLVTIGTVFLGAGLLIAIYQRRKSQRLRQIEEDGEPPTHNND